MTSITLTYVLLVFGHRLRRILPCCEMSFCLAARPPVGPVLDQNLCHPDGVKKLNTKHDTIQLKIVMSLVHNVHKGYSSAHWCLVWIHLVLNIELPVYCCTRILDAHCST